MSGRWLVAMSGGVDSSVAAAVPARQGLDVFGVTMDLGQGNFATAPASGSKRCCGIADAEDARKVARTLGIRHYTMNFRREFRTSVIDPFVAEYEAGRTPIPCVACNRVLKFDLLLSRARSLGAVGVATGHYARIESNAEGELSLQRAVDRTKDQTYFLFDMPAESLERVRFPIGELSKPQVRALAAELGLVTATKPESQGICFVPDGQIRPALRRLKPGLAEREGQISTTTCRLSLAFGHKAPTQKVRKGSLTILIMDLISSRSLHWITW